MNDQTDSREREGICWFCVKRPVKSSAALVAILYNLGGAQSSVIIPRCGRCKRIHDLQNFSSIVGIAIVVIGSIALAALLGSDDLKAAIFVFFVSVFVSGFVFYRLQLLFERGAGVRNLRNVDEHDEVIELKQQTGLQYMKYRN